MSDENNNLPYRIKYSEQKREYNRQAAKEQRQKRISMNLCPECGKPKDGTSYRCSECLEKSRQYKPKKENRDKALEKEKQKKLEWERQQLCNLCGEPAEPGYKRCKFHIEQQRNKRSQHKKDGICPYCNRPVIPDGVTCEYHTNKRIAAYKRKRQLLDSDLCIHCQIPLQDLSYKTCEECRKEKTQAKSNKCKEYLDKGLCRLCGKQKHPDSSVCEWCYFKTVACQHNIGTGFAHLSQEIIHKQNYKCAYSGEALIPGVNSSIDHIVPISKGGSFDISNVQFVTKDVNQLKRNFSEEQFLHLIISIYNTKIKGL